MSHSFRHGAFTFYANGDLSGSVKIVCDPSLIGLLSSAPSRLDVPGDALVAFVAEYVRRAKISALESATTEELLGIKGR